jgi:hypothetical protein
LANQQTETYQGKSLETGFDARKEYGIRAFNQDKKCGFFGTDAC